VIQKYPFPRGKGVCPQSVHQCQKPLHLFSVHLMKARELQLSPTLSVQLISDQLRSIMGIGKLNPATLRDTAHPPPTVPETGTDDAENKEGESRDPDGHCFKPPSRMRSDNGTNGHRKGPSSRLHNI
jgi:hypothetical protein